MTSPAEQLRDARELGPNALCPRCQNYHMLGYVCEDCGWSAGKERDAAIDNILPLLDEVGGAIADRDACKREYHARRGWYDDGTPQQRFDDRAYEASLRAEWSRKEEAILTSLARLFGEG